MCLLKCGFLTVNKTLSHHLGNTFFLSSSYFFSEQVLNIFSFLSANSLAFPHKNMRVYTPACMCIFRVNIHQDARLILYIKSIGKVLHNVKTESY